MLIIDDNEVWFIESIFNFFEKLVIDFFTAEEFFTDDSSSSLAIRDIE